MSEQEKIKIFDDNRNQIGVASRSDEKNKRTRMISIIESRAYKSI